MAEAYEAKVAELEAERREQTQWALDTEAAAHGEVRIADAQELANASSSAMQAEKTVEERTRLGAAAGRRRSANWKSSSIWCGPRAG